MKRIISILFILFWLFLENSFSQTNLVPNSSFEDTVICPQGAGCLWATKYWIGWGSVDYFNECSTFQAGVPSNEVGYQYAHTGVAYSDFGVFHITLNNFREFIEVELIDSLIANKKYHVEFYISLCDSVQYAIWNIGAYFSENGVMVNTIDQILTYIPQVTNTPGNYIRSKNDWTKISGTFIASGGEKFITIGNFEDDSVLDTLFAGGSSKSKNSDWRGSGYYIDDVSVYLDTTSGINNEDNVKFNVNVYPNPANDAITIVFSKETNGNTVFEIYDLLGNKILSKQITSKTKQETISVSQLSEGVYLYKVKGYNKAIHKNKLIIIR